MISLLFFVFASYFALDENVRADKLIYIGTSDAVNSIFYLENLGKISTQNGCSELRLKLVTCPLTNHTSWDHDVLPEEDGFQHVVAICVNSGGEEMIEGTKAALPCPPHCGGEKFEISFSDFVEDYMD